MQEVTTPDSDEILSKKKLKQHITDTVAKTPILDSKGKIDGLMGGKLVEEKKGNITIRARSTIKFIFQILMWIFIYSIVFSFLMILKIDTSLYMLSLMNFIAFCAIGVCISITLYIFYPLIAPRLFDFHLGLFYIKPLSSYIYMHMWDSIHAVPFDTISAIQIIRIETSTGKKSHSIDQTNIVLNDGSRIALIIQKNLLVFHTEVDAAKLAMRLNVPVLDIITVYW